MPLKTGRHQFGFQIVIPDSCPSSYESQFGTIRYTIRVNMVSNLQSATLNEVFPFLVVSRSYFDDVPSAIMRQIEYKDEVDFTVCSLPFGTVYLKIIMPRTGYRLGEVGPTNTARINGLISVNSGENSCQKQHKKGCQRMSNSTHFENTI